jgi:hypothetical protein
MSDIDWALLEKLLHGVQSVVDTPIAFDRGDPDKNRIREIQALVGLLVRSELPSRNAGRTLQLVEQLKLLFEEIVGIGTRVAMKPATRQVEQALGLLRKQATA